MVKFDSYNLHKHELFWGIRNFYEYKEVQGPKIWDMLL